MFFGKEFFFCVVLPCAIFVDSRSIYLPNNLFSNEEDETGIVITTPPSTVTSETGGDIFLQSPSSPSSPQQLQVIQIKVQVLFFSLS